MASYIPPRLQPRPEQQKERKLSKTIRKRWNEKRVKLKKKNKYKSIYVNYLQYLHKQETQEQNKHHGASYTHSTNGTQTKKSHGEQTHGHKDKSYNENYAGSKEYKHICQLNETHVRRLQDNTPQQNRPRKYTTPLTKVEIITGRDTVVNKFVPFHASRSLRLGPLG